jgi:hypothetical protein
MANQRLNATVQIGSNMDRSVGRNIGFIKSGLNGVGAEIKTITNRQQEMSRTRRVLERQGRSVAELDREYEQLGRQLEVLKRRQQAWTRAAQASARVGQNFHSMVGQIGRSARTAGIAIGLVGTAIFGVANSTASLGDEVAKSADALGINVEAYQELRYAAERSGVAIGTFDSSMVAFVKRLGEAEGGVGPAADAINALGLEVDTLIEMKPEDALAEIAERMKDIDNPARRAAIASDLFSRAGVGMVNMLGDGKEGLEDMARAARDTGYVLSERTARGAETFKDRLLDATLTVKGLRNVIGSEFMPVVQRSMEDFSAWAISNRDGVKEFAEAAVLGLERVLPIVGQVAGGMGDVATKVGSVVSKVAEMVGGWDNFGVILGTVMASKAILSVGTFAFSVGKLGVAMWALVPALPLVAGGIRAIGIAIAANPIGIAIAVIAGGALLIWKQWEPISKWFTDMWAIVEEKFAAARIWVGTTLETMGRVTGVTGAWEGLKTALGATLDWIGAKFDWVLEKITPVIESLTWVRDQGARALDAVGDVFGGSMPRSDVPSTRTPYTGSATGPLPVDVGGMQSRATGGIYGPGMRIVGERGREAEFVNRSGFIATNRQTERIAALASGARANVEAAVSAMSGSGGSGGSVTNNISINAAGMSAQAIIDELERRLSRSNSGSLYDQPRGYGQYGNAA